MRSYLEKNRFIERQILQSPPENLRLVVVIPCYNEPFLTKTIQSLFECDFPDFGVEIIVVVNSSEREGDAILKQNQDTIIALQALLNALAHPIPVHILHFPALRHKHAGVGLARKIGMDEAVDRLLQVHSPQGIIACLDADSLIATNYLTALDWHFQAHPKTEACSIRFAHPASGDDFDSAIYEASNEYELFLRYYIQALRWAGYPYAFQTIGSSMAVRADVYQAVGGMNRKKAGEDFYFLQKIIPRGRFSELNETCVFPSPRPSDRVPFGTGKAIGERITQGKTPYHSYDFKIFEELKLWLTDVADWYKNDPKMPPKALKPFLEQENWLEAIVDCRYHVSSQHQFVRRFYAWFHALRLLKFVHFAQANFYPNSELKYSSKKLFNLISNQKINSPINIKELLLEYRNFQINKLPLSKS